MRNRALQVRMVKTDAPVGTDTAVFMTPEQLDALVGAQIQNIAITVGAVLLTKKAADTLSELILIAGRKYI